MQKAILILLTLFALNASAQDVEKWNLQKCVDYALEHNTSVQQGELQGEILSNNLRQAKLGRVPTLNGSGNHNYNIGRTIDPFTNTFSTTTIQSNSFSLSSGVLLYGGSQVNNSIKQSQKATEANKQSIEVVRNQIALSVATTYLQIIQSEENLSIAESQLEITKNQLDRALKLVQSGSVNQSTSLNLKAQLANDRVNVINAQNSIQLGYNALINLMQFPLDQNFEIERNINTQTPTLPSESVATLYEMALENLPEIKQAELQITQSQLGEKVAAGGLQPSLSAYGNINTVYSQSGKEINTTGQYDLVPIGYTKTSLEPVLQPQPITEIKDKAFGNQISDNLGQQVGISLSVPVFNGYRNKTAFENAKLNTKIFELALDNTKNQLRNDITTAYTKLKAAKSRYDASKLSEEAQKLNFEFSQKRFDAGMMNGVDLLTAKNQWSQSLTQMLNAKYEYIFRALIIEFYKGNKLSL
ncbi:TolC family protein [Bacteroidia bacterium]|nr:TolC family protein [Bacteroidia bacterium]